MSTAIPFLVVMVIGGGLLVAGIVAARLQRSEAQRDADYSAFCRGRETPSPPWGRMVAAPFLSPPSAE